jgi:hypothetical protein
MMFNTNVVMLTQGMSRKVVKAGVTGVFISDSLNKEHFESVKVGVKFMLQNSFILKM